MKLGKRVMVYPGTVFPDRALALWDGKACVELYHLVQPSRTVLCLPIPVSLEPLRLKNV